MREKPIIFSSEMVRAILDGRKKQTRRVIKPQPTGVHYRLREDEVIDYSLMLNDNAYHPEKVYQTGYVLWVREIWGERVAANLCPSDDTWNGSEFFYKASYTAIPDFKWRPSIHMPRSAARIFLRVTDVRVERLQDISEDDVRAEGIHHITCEDCSDKKRSYCGASGDCTDVILTFSNLWNSLNAKRGFDWESNPWIFVISFERVKDYEQQ